MKALASQNTDYGFYGTTICNGRLKIRTEWPAAFKWVASAMPNWTAENVRDFLDSRCGRHLADEASSVKGVANVKPERWVREFLAFGEEVGIGDSMKGLREKIAADKAIAEAEKHLHKAMEELYKILKNLPPEGEENAGELAMKEYATDRLDKIEAYFSTEQ